MDFTIPADIRSKLAELDAFIEKEIQPLEREHMQFFDHRREHARTDWDNGGRPRREWEELLHEMRRRADAAGHLRYALPRELGGQGASNLAMAIVREHLAAKGLGLHNDLQNESSVVGNFPTVHMMLEFGTPEQKKEFLPGMITGTHRVAFGLTEPDHGSDATWLETTAVRDGGDWVINGKKRFNSGMHHANYDMVFARTAGAPGAAEGITCFLVPADTPGLSVDFMWWTFNMPSDHAEVTLENVRVPHRAIFGEEGKGLALAQHFVHENRIRQAASGVGAAQYCVNESVAYAKERLVFGKPLWLNQAIQFPLAELQTECEMVRNLVYKTAWLLDQQHRMEVTDKVSMCN
ncbi:MAG TPA: acyl-CoA dehydrogenase family protein, partial [Candidatus Margulisiibacteriota bacterium]|nr:acyl-CoA dehydrogenase family protein [Candidatus Margulisiibacteriota bacterium]